VKRVIAAIPTLNIVLRGFAWKLLQIRIWRLHELLCRLALKSQSLLKEHLEVPVACLQSSRKVYQLHESTITPLTSDVRQQRKEGVQAAFTKVCWYITTIATWLPSGIARDGKAEVDGNSEPIITSLIEILFPSIY
jgi:hypothetical protein